MKTKKIGILAATFMMVLLAGCSSKKNAEPEEMTDESIAIESTQESSEISNEQSSQEDALLENSSDELAAGEKTDQESFDELVALLGKNDEEAAGMLSGGTENKSADGELLIGRIYTSEIFGEKISVNTLYDDKNMVNMVSFEVSGKGTEEYIEKLNGLTGQTASSDTATTESGAISSTWKMDGKIITLYEMQDQNIIEILLPVQ